MIDKARASLIRQVLAYVGIASGITTQAVGAVHLPPTLSAVLALAGGAILTVEHYMSHPLKPAPTPEVSAMAPLDYATLTPAQKAQVDQMVAERQAAATAAVPLTDAEVAALAAQQLGGQIVTDLADNLPAGVPLHPGAVPAAPSGLAADIAELVPESVAKLLDYLRISKTGQAVESVKSWALEHGITL